jgi:ElaB/YqjD/DUF883 family membrane-anchored ribosome-binding protein
MENVKDFENAANAGKDKMKSMAYDLDKNFKEGQEKLKDIASCADKKLRENPWPVVIGVGVSSLLIGFLMGSRRG